jgi:antitoxin FitA
MTTTTLKNIPDELYARIRAHAALHRRSINQEILTLLEYALAQPPARENIYDAFAPIRAAYRGPPLSIEEIQALIEEGGRP